MAVCILSTSWLPCPDTSSTPDLELPRAWLWDRFARQNNETMIKKNSNVDHLWVDNYGTVPKLRWNCLDSCLQLQPETRHFVTLARFASFPWGFGGWRRPTPDLALDGHDPRATEEGKHDGPAMILDWRACMCHSCSWIFSPCTFLLVVFFSSCPPGPPPPHFRIFTRSGRPRQQQRTSG